MPTGRRVSGSRASTRYRRGRRARRYGIARRLANSLSGSQQRPAVSTPLTAELRSSFRERAKVGVKGRYFRVGEMRKALDRHERHKVEFTIADRNAGPKQRAEILE